MKKHVFLFSMLLMSALLSAQSSELSKVAVVHDQGNWIKFLPEARIAPENFFFEFQSDLGLDSNYSFELLKKETDKLGMTHFKFQEYFKGNPIEGGNYILHAKDGFITHANGELIRQLSEGNSMAMTANDGLTIAKNYMGAELYYWEVPEMEARIKHIKNDPTATFFPKGELVYAHPDFRLEGKEYKLAWKYEIYAPRPVGKKTVYVDTQSGEVLFALEGCHDGAAEGVAETRYSGTQTITTDSISETEFRLIDTTRGGGIETYDANENTDISQAIDFVDDDNHWDNANEEMDDAATDVHWGMAQAYDYYLGIHDRNSFDGQGAPIVSYVHVDQNWFNATFNGLWAEFGDGNSNPLTSIDVAAHELTHGVTDNAADLVYMNEPGALNESFSDIFGVAVEFFARGEEADWQIGAANFLLRDMANPNEFDQPDTYSGTHWYTGVEDNGGVHINSGVQNYWFYLLCNGVTGVNDNGDAFTVDSIGMEKAAKIAYRNLTVYLSQVSDYYDARSGSLQAAEDLYGSCSEEVMQVANAWYAVGVGASTITHDAELLEVLSPLDSGCDLGDSELVQMTIRYNPTGCSHTLEAGDEIDVSYQVNNDDPIVETITLTETLEGGDVLNYTFATTADLSEIGDYEFNFAVILEGDLNPFNDEIYNVDLSKPMVLDDDNTITFEVLPLVYDSFYVVTYENSLAFVSSTAENTGARGFKMSGQGVTPDNITIPSTEDENFTANPTFVSKLCLCMDATEWDEAYLSFDLRQTYSEFYEQFIGLDIPFAIALRVTVDGNQVGNQFHPTTNEDDPYLTHLMDLNAYAGTAFTLCFEGMHFLNEDEDPLGGAGDKTLLDNIFLSQNEILGVGDAKLTEAEIYPNPTSGKVSVQLNATGLQQVSVLDILGNQLQIENWNASGSPLEVDLSEFAAGVYFISIQSETVNAMQKIVVE